MELVAVFLIALGAGVLLWCLFGLLLMPVFGPEMVTLCFASGDGRFLEQRARAFGWLRDGWPRGGRLVIVDRGLSAVGRQRALRLCRQYAWVSCCREELPVWLEQKDTDCI